MGGSLLTSTEVADRLGVTAATVKRWADEGLLACARTAGRHRRFEPDEVERFRRARGGGADPSGGFLDRLLDERGDVLTLQAELLEQRARRGAWWRVAEWLGPHLEELGRRWQEGRIGILEEHLASDRLARALARCGEALPSRPSAPRVLLAAAEGEEHLLGLALVDLCLREEGWRPRWAGRVTPVAEVIRLVEEGAVEAVALSASVSARADALAEEAVAIGDACRRRGVALVVGGAGPWPERLGYGRVERRFEGLRAWAAEVERG